jgi:ABC-2 type transport system permease protein
MARFWGLARYEYRMSIQRWGIWVILGLLFAFYSANAVMVDVKPGDQPWQISDIELWQTAGLLAFSLNLFSPLVAGIALADRMQRDVRLGVDELLSSTGLTRRAYILGKYAGGLFSMLTPMFLMMSLMGLLTVITGAPLAFLGRLMLGFLAINVPAFAFVAIFSMGFPLVMPVRVYQVLFTGYWFWGNFLNPAVFPTLSHTLLAPGGRYALEAFFGTHFGAAPGYVAPTALDAVLNLAMLATCIVVAMFLLDRYLAWRASRD